MLQGETVVSSGSTVYLPWTARDWLIVRNLLDAVDQGRLHGFLSIDRAVPPLIGGSTTQALIHCTCAEGILYSYLCSSGESGHPSMVTFMYTTGVGLYILTIDVLSPTEAPLLLWFLLLSSAEGRADRSASFARPGRVAT